MKDEVILFDLDDTLVVEYESAQQSFLVTCEYARQYGVDSDFLFAEVQKKAKELWYGMPTIEYCLEIGISSWEGLWADFIGEHEMLKELHSNKEKYQVNTWYRALLSAGVDNIALARELSQLFRAERRERHILTNGALEQLVALSKNYRLGLITNGTPDLQREKIQGAKIESFFEHIIISGEVDVAKPKREIFLLATKRFGINLDQFIMVGDSLRSDISGAKNAGIKSVWLNAKNKKLDDTLAPEAVIDNLFQLPQVIERILES